MTIELSALQQQRRDTAANWTGQNPTLLTAEIGYETDTGKFKIGDGSTAWTSLGYLPIPDNNGLIPIDQLLLPAGTAAAPSLAFDANTGIYSPGADQVGISTAGTSRLIIDSSGNVGIGTTNPGANLEIKAASIPAIRLNQADTYYAPIKLAGNDLEIRGSSGTIEFYNGANNGDSSTEKMRIDSSGRVGIGTSAINSYSAIADNLLIAGSSNAGMSIIDSGDSTQSSLYFYGGTTRRHYIEGGSGASGILTIQSNNAVKFNIGTSEQLRLDSSGRLLLNGGTDVRMEFGTTGTTGTNNRNHIRGDGSSLKYNTCSGGLHIFEQNGSERMRIDSSGNVGIGTSSPSSRLHVKGGSLTTEHGSPSTGTCQFNINCENNSQVTLSYDDQGHISFGTASAPAAQTGFSEKVRIDSSGRLLVGTSSASNQNNAGGASAREAKAYIFNANATTTERISLAINSGSANASGASINLNKTRATTDTHTVVQSGDLLGEIRFQGSDGTYYVQGARIEAAVDGTPGSQDMPGRLVFSTTADGASSPTERMRIKNYGQIYTYVDSPNAFAVGTSASTSATNACIYLQAGATGIDTGTITFRVQCNGDVDNTNNSYGAISDVKLKENIVDANSQWSDIKSIQVRNYNYKEETGFATHTQIGVIAQEIESVSPGLVTDTPDVGNDGNDLDTTTKSVNYSVLYMKAVKALQEAMDRIETLEAKVAALEAS
jgi:hypothetical protein